MPVTLNVGDVSFTSTNMYGAISILVRGTTVIVVSKEGKYEYDSVAKTGSDLEYEFAVARIEFLYQKGRMSPAMWVKKMHEAGFNRYY